MIIEKVQYHRYVVDEMIERFQARMFNREASDPKNRPDRVLEVLKLQLGQRIADTELEEAISLSDLHER